MATNALKGNLFLLGLASTASGTDYETVAALRTTSLTFNKATVDVTNKDAQGWQELMPGGGVRSAAISASGIYSNTEDQLKLIEAFNHTGHWNAEVEDEAGNTFTGAWNIDSLAFTGDHNAEHTFDITLSSSDVITFEAGNTAPSGV